MDRNLLDSDLKMPPRKRVTFSELILGSIDHEEEEVRELWVSEVRERIKEVN